MCVETSGTSIDCTSKSIVSLDIISTESILTESYTNISIDSGLLGWQGHNLDSLLTLHRVKSGRKVVIKCLSMSLCSAASFYGRDFLSLTRFKKHDTNLGCTPILTTWWYKTTDGFTIVITLQTQCCCYVGRD